MKFSFNSDDQQEVIRAGRVVRDMLRRGYILLVQPDPKSEEMVRAQGFDEKTSEYIIADFDPEGGEDVPDVNVPVAPIGAKVPPRNGRRKKKGRPAKKRVPARKTKALAVGPVAGG